MAYKFSFQEKYQEKRFKYFKWVWCDNLVQANIGPSLSSDMLEHVWNTSPSKKVYEYICKLFRLQTLLNKLHARHEFYVIKNGSQLKNVAVQ